MMGKKIFSSPFNSWRLLALAGCLAGMNAACAAGGAKQAPAVPESSKISTYHWYDGSKRRELRVEQGVAADFAASATTKSGSPVMRKATKAQSLKSPVFVDATSSTTQRALPGGVLVRFRRPVSQAAADELLAQFNTKTLRPIGSAGTMWLVSSPAGMPSLTLANQIFESGLVKSASPNWWKQRALK